MAKEHIHLIGIGGTGMTAVAGLLHDSGCRVTGSDGRLYPPTSTILERLGLEVHEGFDAARLSPAPDLVVVGNAISRGNPEVEELLDRRLAYTSMPRLIAERFLDGRHAIVVAGTHGKTTTASMLAWVLQSAGREPGFLIGGAPANFESSFRIGRGAPFVIEGDEYDTAFFDKGPKFMHYRPDTALVGKVEFDHADIYGDVEQVTTVFRRLVNLVPRRGLLVFDADCAITREVAAGALSRVEGYGFENGLWRAGEFAEEDSGAVFRLLLDGARFADISLSVAGMHNVRNALAAVVAAREQCLTAEEIAAGLASFRGVSRRLELKGEVGGVMVLDDFAHHPTAIAETLATLRRRYPDRRIRAVVEPRSWSMRRNVFQERLSLAFDAADEVVIAEVHAADALAIDERLDPERLIDDLKARGAEALYLPKVETIVSHLSGSAHAGDVIVVMSNGAFGGIHGLLLKALRSFAERGVKG